MYMTCRHIKTNGIQCGSPALKSKQFCYYHARIRTFRDAVMFGPLQLPVPEDGAAIQLSVALINEAILNGSLDLRKAGLLLSGLKLAARFIDRKPPLVAAPAVSTIEQDNRGEELAPRHFVCDEDDDCDSCPYKDHCPHPGHPGDDDLDEEDYEDDEEQDEDVEEEEEEDEEDTHTNSSHVRPAAVHRGQQSSGEPAPSEAQPSRL